MKENVIKGVCKGTGIMLTPPFDGDLGIILSLGTTDRYCAQFGGDEAMERRDADEAEERAGTGGMPVS